MGIETYTPTTDFTAATPEELSGIHPENLIDAFDRHGSAAMESVAMFVGADAVTAVFAGDTVERNGLREKRETQLATYGPAMGAKVTESEVGIFLVNTPPKDPFDAEGFLAYQTDLNGPAIAYQDVSP